MRSWFEVIGSAEGKRADRRPSVLDSAERASQLASQQRIAIAALGSDWSPGTKLAAFGTPPILPARLLLSLSRGIQLRQS